MKEVTLSNGIVAVISKGKGKHVQEAQKIAGTDSSKFMAAMIAQLVTINGLPVVYEDLMELEAEDYLSIMTVWSELNFTATTQDSVPTT